MSKRIVFIDSRVSNYASLIDGLADTDEVFVLDGESDGLTQMAAALQGLTGFDAIHVMSHGSAGALVLGSTALDGGNLAAYRVQLAGIGSAFNAGGDILLYGCNVAQGEAGLQFITSLADLAGADVAASDDAEGAAALIGDGVLEQGVGSVVEDGLLVEEYPWLLATNIAPTYSGRSGAVVTVMQAGGSADCRR